MVIFLNKKLSVIFGEETHTEYLIKKGRQSEYYDLGELSDVKIKAMLRHMIRNFTLNGEAYFLKSLHILF